jgi:hypothetical protein
MEQLFGSVTTFKSDRNRHHQDDKLKSLSEQVLLDCTGGEIEPRQSSMVSGLSSTRFHLIEKSPEKPPW